MIGRAATALLLLACLAPAAAISQPDASPESQIPENQIKTAINGIYARYRNASLAGGPADDSALYSRRTRDLIARWHAGQPDDEVTTMGDFDWFCQCQDYDDKTFAIAGLTVRKGHARAYEAAIAYHLGWGGTARLKLVMINEDGGWKVDDIVFARDAGLASLRAGLAAEIRDFAR